jgi:hypothetical protein
MPSDRENPHPTSTKPTEGLTDCITIIRGGVGRRLAKLVRNDGTIEGYRAGYRFDLITHPVPDLGALHQLVEKLLHRPDRAVVWGVPIDPTRCEGVRRLAFQCKKTGDEPTLRDAAHKWVALDMDSVPLPEGIAAADLAACGHAAVRRLPAAFRAAAVIVQATASHGIKPGIRVRLWYWLSRPTTGAELKCWLRGHVDDCTFRATQPIYIAAPVFGAGVSDHLPERITLLSGRPFVTVPDPTKLAAPEPRATPPMPAAIIPGSGHYVSKALASAANRVRKAGIGNRHATIVNEARGLARFIKAGRLAASVVTETLIDAGRANDKPKDEIQAAIAWALDHPSTAMMPEGDDGTQRKAGGTDPRRRETARAAFRMLRRGVPSNELLIVLHRLNEDRSDPLPPHDIRATALWAARQLKERAARSLNDQANAR